MDGGGFEPPKSVTTDLQSAPFAKQPSEDKKKDTEEDYDFFIE